LRACEFGLIAGLFFKDRRDKGRDGFQLMAVRPRQQLFDIVLKACRRFACSHDNHELKASSLTCLGTPIYNKCPDIRPKTQKDFEEASRKKASRLTFKPRLKTGDNGDCMKNGNRALKPSKVINAPNKILTDKNNIIGINGLSTYEIGSYYVSLGLSVIPIKLD